MHSRIASLRRHSRKKKPFFCEQIIAWFAKDEWVYYLDYTFLSIVYLMLETWADKKGKSIRIFSSLDVGVLSKCLGCTSSSEPRDDAQKFYYILVKRQILWQVRRCVSQNQKTFFLNYGQLYWNICNRMTVFAKACSWRSDIINNLKRLRLFLLAPFCLPFLRPTKDLLLYTSFNPTQAQNVAHPNGCRRNPSALFFQKDGIWHIIGKW